MMLDYINEAFKSLDLLTEDVFKADSEGINELSDFIEDDEAEETISIIDMDAETEDDLQDSYVGKVIVDCNVCHSHVFKNKEDIKLDDDGVVDIEEDCPYCGDNNGFVIIGEIHEFNPDSDTEESTDKQSEVAEETAEVDEVTGESEEVNESLTEAIKEDVDPNVFAELQEYAEDADDMFISHDSEYADYIDELYMKAVEKLKKEFRDLFIEPSIQGTAGSVFANYNADDGVHETSWEFENELEFLDEIILSSTSEEDYIDKIVEYLRNKLNAASVVEEDEGVVEVDESLNEESNMSKLKSRYPELSGAASEKLEESFNNVSIETDDQKMTMTSEDNGKVIVTTEPTTAESTEGEVIAPVSSETEEEIIDANAEVVDEPVEEETPSEEELDFDFDEVDEDSMSELGESYLKRVYENVDSFKLTSCSTTPTQLVLEGLITFKSGVKKNTGFIFEAKDATKDGKLRFIGENAHLCRGRKAFTLVGSMSAKKLMCESFTYNYRAKNADGKSTRVYGKVTKSK